MNKIVRSKQQQGFSILGVIIAIVVVIAAIGVWALSGQSNTNITSGNIADIQATTLTNDSNPMKLAFDDIILKGTAATTVTFAPNTAGATNVLDTTNGANYPRVNAAAVRAAAAAPEGLWVYNGTTFKANVGTTAADQALLVAGVKDSVCQRLNNSLYGSTTIPAVAAITTGAAFVTGATAAAPVSVTAVDSSGLAAVAGWNTGCVSANGVADNNLYFRVLKQN